MSITTAVSASMRAGNPSPSTRRSWRRSPSSAGQSLRDIEVGREVLRARDRITLRPGIEPQRRRQQLEEIDRGGIRDHHLAVTGADQPRDLVADALGQLDPAMPVPAGDEVFAPFLLDDRARSRAGVALGRAPSELPSR